KRGVTELVTPGVVFNENVLENKANNFLASVYILSDRCGVAFLDISTGEFLAGEGSVDYIRNLLQSYNPSEIIHQKTLRPKFLELFGEQYHLYGLEEWIFEEDFARELLLKQFGVNNLKGFGIEELPRAKSAAGAILHYLGETR